MIDNSLKIILKEGLRKGLDDFCGSFDIRIAFFDAFGKEVKVGMDRKLCEFCNLLRGCPAYFECCRECDQKYFRQAVLAGKLTVYHCHAGLLEAIKPVVIEGCLIGFIMMGQFRDSSNCLCTKRFPAISGERLTAAFNRVPYYHPDRVRHICGLFETLVDSSIRYNYYNIEGKLNLLRIKNYIRSHINHSISINEVAIHLNCCASTISHFVKRHFGRSFKELMIEMKLQEAEKLLADVPEIKIRDVAARIGYDDPYYFSRIFKKYRGQPPSAFLGKRTKLHCRDKTFTNL